MNRKLKWANLQVLTRKGLRIFFVQVLTLHGLTKFHDFSPNPDPPVSGPMNCIGPPEF